MAGLLLGLNSLGFVGKLTFEIDAKLPIYRCSTMCRSHGRQLLYDTGVIQIVSHSDRLTRMAAVLF